jgi:hypothetical protein
LTDRDSHCVKSAIFSPSHRLAESHEDDGHLQPSVAGATLVILEEPKEIFLLIQRANGIFQTTKEGPASIAVGLVPTSSMHDKKHP